MKSKITISLVILLLPLVLLSQNFVEKQLPPPEQLSKLFIGPLFKSTIHYGKKPSNYNGKVLLFNHGYIDLNQLFFTNNTFYQDAYNEGYQVVFVATTRGKGMWENGKLLAEAIDITTQKYFVPSVTIIAHSNGGKAAEVAMFKHQKKEKVNRVITLGTPFWGTYLADISQKWWFNWIWKRTGLNEGSATSTTYYCKDVVRPYFDKHPNNQPEKFVTLGASGFKNGHTLLAPAMLATGAILYVAQGTNDGVTPYSSSKRPGATNVFAKGQAKIDHVDIALGQYVWKHIKPYLHSNSAKKTNLNTTAQNVNISSDYQLINSENTYQKIVNNSGKELILEVFHETNKNNFSLTANNKQLLKEYQHKAKQPLVKHVSYYTVKSKDKLITLKGNGRFAAFIHNPNGPIMHYETNKDDNELIVSFKNTKESLQNIKVNAIISKTSDLLGKPEPSDSFVYELVYNPAKNVYNLNTSDFEDGVYSVSITGKSKQFTRSLISGFTVGKITNGVINNNDTYSTEVNNSNLTLVTNQIENSIVLLNNSTTVNNLTISIYNLNGQLQLTQKLQNNNGRFSLNNGLNRLTKGLYILTTEQNNLRKSFKIIKK